MVVGDVATGTVALGVSVNVDDAVVVDVVADDAYRGHCSCW